MIYPQNGGRIVAIDSATSIFTLCIRERRRGLWVLPPGATLFPDDPGRAGAGDVIERERNESAAQRHAMFNTDRCGWLMYSRPKYYHHAGF